MFTLVFGVQCMYVCMCQPEIFIIMCGLPVCTAAKGAQIQSLKKDFRVTPCGKFWHTVCWCWNPEFSFKEHLAILNFQLLENVFNVQCMQYLTHLHISNTNCAVKFIMQYKLYRSTTLNKRTLQLSVLDLRFILWSWETLSTWRTLRWFFILRDCIRLWPNWISGCEVASDPPWPWPGLVMGNTVFKAV